MFTSIMNTLSQGAVGVFVTGLALVLMALALIRMGAGWMVAAAFLTVPYTYTAGDWSGFLILVRLLPLTQIFAALAIDREDSQLAWVLSAPTLLTLGYSFYDILVKQQAFQLLVN